MFKVNQDMHPNPYAEKAYEDDPNLQIIYNSIEEVTKKFPHIRRLQDIHQVRLGIDDRMAFRLEIIQVDASRSCFSFRGFVFVAI